MVVRVTWKRALTTAALLLALGMTIAWTGIINIGASTGHWAITDWFLHWAMRNTARTYAALTVDEPAADPRGLVSAAGHYAGSCAVCHGAPGQPPSPVMQASTPHAPDLSVTAGTYTNAELFWIIKHGIKFTPMPAWPTLERDDEVRRMVAFVRLLPEMTPAEYLELAFGPVGTIAGAHPIGFEDALDECERCHAEDGRRQPDIPVLAGQKPVYLLEALDEFATGRRDSGVMAAAAARVDPDLRRELAEHYAGLEGLTDRPERVAAGSASEENDTERPLEADEAIEPVDVEGLAEAAEVVANGLPAIDLPACSKCHAPGKRPDYPRLAGQKMEYMTARLRRWRADEDAVEARQPDEPMPVIARRIPERLIEPLARYFAGEEP